MQWIAALYVSYEGAGVILQAAGEAGEEVRCLVPRSASVALQWAIAQVVHTTVCLKFFAPIGVVSQGPPIPPSEDDVRKATTTRRERMGSVDPLPLGADPNWRDANKSNTAYG